MFLSLCNYVCFINNVPCPFDYIAVTMIGKVGILLIGLKHTNLVAVATRTDHPKSIRNHCVMKVFGSVFALSLLSGNFCGCKGFCNRK